jgi:hypothetical protein
MGSDGPNELESHKKEMSIETALFRELRLAKAAFDAVKENPHKSESEFKRVVDAYHLALSRFSAFVMGGAPAHLQEFTGEEPLFCAIHSVLDGDGDQVI